MQEWSQASAELVRVARGRRSQRGLAMRLGYRGNPVSRWESGERAPSAAEGLRILQLGGADLAAACSLFPAAPPLPEDIDDAAVARWLSALARPRPSDAVVAALGRDRTTVWRWLAGRTRPRLPELLHLLHLLTGQGTEFLDRLVGIENLPCLADRHERILQARAVFLDEPASSVVRWMVTTRAYRDLPAHRPGWIARRIDIDLETEERCLQALRAAGVIRWSQERWVATGVPHVRLRGDLDASRRLNRGRFEQALRSIGQGGLVRSNVFAADAETIQELRGQLLQSYEAIRARTLHTTDPDQVGSIGV